MKYILQNRITLILVIILAFFLASCGYLDSGGSGGGGSSPAVCIEYDDFDDNTLDTWTPSGSAGYAVSVIDGVVHMTAPANTVNYSPAASASILKSVSLSGDFVVTINTVQQAEDSAEWRHKLVLSFDDNNSIGFMDGDDTRLYEPGWIISKTVNGVNTELFYGNTNGQGGIENVLTTMKIKKVGSVYTFSIIRSGVETVVTTRTIPDFTSFSEVVFTSWAHYIPVDMEVDNFKAWADTSKTSCTP